VRGAKSHRLKFSALSTDDWDNRPYLLKILRLKVQRQKKIRPGVGVRRVI